MLTQQRQVYFSILDAFRFIAFFRIFLLHLPAFEGNSFFFKIVEGGEIGVDFFFVLSGFLITYLLLKEHNLTGKVDGKKYMKRRALRIWPLYFLGVAIAYAGNYFSLQTATDSGAGYSPKLFYSLTFLENYQMIFSDTFPSGAPLRVFWSICVEEHFYILWLVLFKLIAPKNLPKVFLLLWVTGIVYRILFFHFFPGKMVYDADIFSKMDYFCSGALAGYVLCNYYNESKMFIKYIPAYIRNIFLLIMLAGFFMYQFLFTISRSGSVLFPIPAAILSGAVIFIAVFSINFQQRAYKSLLAKLGKISYGLYVYHTVVIVLLMKIATHYTIAFTANKIIYAAFCLICFLITVCISFLSYRFFETYFLKLKPQVVVTGNNKIK